MIVMGIETSCDETAVAIVTTDRTIMAERIWSQVNDHKSYGGVVPEIAARAHLQKLNPLVQETLAAANLSMKDIDLIAVTSGPGLIGGVIVGLTFAKALSLTHDIPLIGVNHLAGHILSPRLQETISFPYLCLLVSGGHTQLVLVKGVNDVHILGETLDDAAGEAFDKGAKMLGLGFPGGPALARSAQDGDPKRFVFTQPLLSRKDCLDLSFSGLKTALSRKIETLARERNTQNSSQGLTSQGLTLQETADLAAGYEKTIVTFLLKRLVQAVATCHAQGIFPSTLVIAGGVGANKRLQAGLKQLSVETMVPAVILPPALCTDNAAMIAWAGIESLQHKGMHVMTSEGKSQALQIKPRPRWPLTEGFYSDLS